MASLGLAACPLPGPWLEPGFREKGFQKRPDLVVMAKQLIDRFNKMIQSVASTAGFGHVHFVDLRDTLGTGADYKKWWDNELHPTEKGFRAVTFLFQQVLRTLP